MALNDIILEQENEVWYKIHAEPGIIQELSDELTFEVPSFKFVPKEKKKYWDGKIRLVKRNKIYRGLLFYITDFAKRKGYSIKYNEEIQLKQNFDLNKFISLLNLPYELRDYQLRGVQECFFNTRRIVLSATASGKSLIIYILCRLFHLFKKKILILVPTINLVNQLESDFSEYSEHNSWNVEKYVTKIYGGQEYKNTPITISTWQSQLNSDNLSQYDVVICDEVHLFKAKEVTKILENLKNAAFRYGFTGTLDNTACNELVLQGLFGESIRINRTTELIQENILNDFTIECCVLDYSDEEKKQIFKKAYNDEIEFLISHEKRNSFIVNLIKKMKGNTLVVFSRVDKHGKILYNELSNVLENRNVYFIYGKIKGAERENVRKIIETESDSIIVASRQIFSEGINIPSLKNLVFVHPSKSNIKLQQIIGRILRKKSNKNNSVVYDIVDNLTFKGRQNYAYKHFIHRLSVYNVEDFKYTIHNLGERWKKS